MIEYGGVVIAACITGSVVALGWRASNRGKINEFRQEWINSLREDVSALISNYTMYLRLSSMAAANTQNNDCINSEDDEHIAKIKAERNKNSSDRNAALADEVNEKLSEVIRLSNIILMRLNPVKSRRSKAENKLYKLIEKAAGISSIDVRTIEVSSIRESSKKVLKEEWKRVQRSDFWAIGITIAGLITALLITYFIK